MSSRLLRVLVTGSRTWDDAEYIERVLEQLLADSAGMLLVHGACPTGADAIADQWAIHRVQQGANILVDRFPARWDKAPRTAGLQRNAEMVQAITQNGVAGVRCEAFVRDQSRGTSHCAKLARRAGIPVTVHRWETR